MIHYRKVAIWAGVPAVVLAAMLVPVPCLPLSPYEHGYLFVHSIPWTMVYIDGKKVGLTPVVKHKLRQGKYKVTLLNTAAGVDRTYTVKIIADQDTQLVIRFKGQNDALTTTEATGMQAGPEPAAAEQEISPDGTSGGTRASAGIGQDEGKQPDGAAPRSSTPSCRGASCGICLVH